MRELVEDLLALLVLSLSHAIEVFLVWVGSAWLPQTHVVEPLSEVIANVN
jgi:hypothetical protein